MAKRAIRGDTIREKIRITAAAVASLVIAGWLMVLAITALSVR